MVSRAPVQITVVSTQTTPLSTVDTVIGIVGGNDGADAGISLEQGGQTAMRAINDASEIADAFGTSTAANAARLLFSYVNANIVGIVVDTTLDGTAGTPVTDATIDANYVSAIASFETALTVVGHKPTILCLSGRNGSTVTAQMKTTLEKMSAVGFITADSTSITNAKNWSTTNGGPRLYPIPQTVTAVGGGVTFSAMPGDDFLACALVRNDSLFGVNDNFSNRPLLGVSSVDPRRSFEYTSAVSDAVDLRNSYLNSVARDVQGNWIVIGGQAKTSSATDPLRYIGVRRMADVITERIAQIGIERWNRNQVANFMDGLIADVNSYLSLLILNGTLREGSGATYGAGDSPTARAAGQANVGVSLIFPSINELVNFDVTVSLA